MPNSMAVWLDDDESPPQFIFGICRENLFQFTMNCILCGGQYAEIQNTCPQRLYEYETTEIAVARDEDAILLFGYLE